MSDTIIFKTDPKLKSEAKQVASNMGLTLSAVLNNSLKELVKKKSVSFISTSKLPQDPYGIFAGAKITEKDLNNIKKSWMKSINEITQI